VNSNYAFDAYYAKIKPLDVKIRLNFDF